MIFQKDFIFLRCFKPLLFALFAFVGTFIPSAGQTETVTLTVNISIPPYFIKELDSGIEYEIIRESFHHSGVDVSPVFHRAGPRIEVYKKKEVQCISTVSPDSKLPGYYSDTVIGFQNAVITLSKKNIKIETMSDLGKINIIAFSGAKKYLGKDYDLSVAGNIHYRERLKNDLLPVLLFKERVDAVITDVRIFEYFQKKISGRVNTSEPVTIHPIFPIMNYSIACHDKHLIDLFNEGLRKVKQEGRYDKIIDKYTKDFNLIDPVRNSIDD